MLLFWAPLHVSSTNSSFNQTCWAHCRQYTFRFARHMVELFPGFVADQPHRLLPPAPGVCIFWDDFNTVLQVVSQQQIK